MTTCSAAPKIAYGSIQTSTSTFVNYTCDAGYSMQGNPFIECSNGVWNMTNYPICLVSLEPYSNSGMDYHADSNTTRDTAPEWSTWFVYGVMGSGGCLALAIVVFCLLACCHICGCCAGPMVAVGGRYQYSDRRWYSVFTWCDFMLKGKVCRKIRKV
ncbi:uncharacterized protein LOC117331008 [Pecten maximus]|uniref:uncharacterized protein LOC117331008 n=1 Tax=Pecten maximus TaxID=6579 RepID=UPI0014584048|nr:uncharacterized protein LOC117331008 [Pecten maximus]